jgi:enolase
MHYALTKKKPVINVYLEQTELSPGMEMQIGNLFALMKYTYPSEEYFYDKLFSADEMIEIYTKWVAKYPIVSIEDGLDQNDWEAYLFWNISRLDEIPHKSQRHIGFTTSS